MSDLDLSQARLYIYTYKEGLLSAIAHDLKIEATAADFSVSADGAITVVVHADSLLVVCARKDGQDAPRLLGDSDKRKIEASIVKEVLKAKKHPTIKFTAQLSDLNQSRLKGHLSLSGVQRSVSAQITEADGKVNAKVHIHQPDFGIRPFTAMLGTLKIQAGLDIEAIIPGTLS